MAYNANNAALDSTLPGGRGFNRFPKRWCYFVEQSHAGAYDEDGANAEIRVQSNTNATFFKNGESHRLNFPQKPFQIGDHIDVHITHTNSTDSSKSEHYLHLRVTAISASGVVTVTKSHGG